MTNARPVHEIRLAAIKAAIWRNDTEGDTSPRFNVTLNRIYRIAEDARDQGDNGWRQTSSLGRDDLLNAAKVLDLAHTWVCQQQQRGSTTQQASEQEDAYSTTTS